MPSAKRERQREGRQARVAAAYAHQQRRQRWRLLRNVAIAALAIVGVIVYLASRTDDKSTVSTASSAASTAPTSSTTTTTVPPKPFEYGTGACPNADGSSARTIDFTAAPQKCIDPSKAYTATFDTTAGKVVIKLDTTTTPGTANNFIVLSRYHYYDGTQFFRTAKSIGIIQGGSPHGDTASDKGPGYSLQDEGFDFDALPKTGAGASGGPYSYSPGDLVMARRAVANGAGAQFFFAVNAQTAQLDGQGVYVKFGSATEGVDVLINILSSAPADEQPPSPPVTIRTVTISES